MELRDLAGPPPAAEPLATAAVSNMMPLTAGELTLSLDTHFTPDRVGLATGTTAIVLYGQLGPERSHPGSDYQQTDLGTHIVMQRVRLGRYRWALSEIGLEPPCVTVAVDRVALAPRRVVPALAAGEQCTVWLSTLGVDNLELETRANPQLPEYTDYVEVSLWSYEQTTHHAWFAALRARRVLAGYDTARWERTVEVGAAMTPETAPLGDHVIEVLDGAWVNDRAPFEVHARIRVTRRGTAEGMTRSAPPPPFILR